MRFSTRVARAPIVNIMDGIPGLDLDNSDIYSMFRLRAGYTGYCRRVMRLSDSAELDVGFTAGGLYDIKKEIEWAGGSSTIVIRWYNQSGSGSRPAYLLNEKAGSIVATVSGVPVFVGGYPGIKIPGEDALTPETYIPLVPTTGYATALWIGSAYRQSSYDTALWSIHEEGSDGARTFKINDLDLAKTRDPGFYYERYSECTHPTSDFSSESIICARYQTGSPYEVGTLVNGSDRSITYYNAPVSGLGFGCPMLLGSSNVHTFIMVDDFALSDYAENGLFNRLNWVY
ncbi:MAG: hypothetical protein IPL86_15900 [Flavobacteriales bacterium]|nr:hypothetical protein [Flavobacteriales bacterium]